MAFLFCIGSNVHSALASEGTEFDDMPDLEDVDDKNGTCRLVVALPHCLSACVLR